MTENKEELLYHDENTLRKVYEGLLKAGIFGQQAVDVVNEIQNQGILFCENKPKRRGRPPKLATPKEESQESVEDDAWKPKEVLDAKSPDA